MYIKCPMTKLMKNYELFTYWWFQITISCINQDEKLTIVLVSGYILILKALKYCNNGSEYVFSGNTA